MDVAGSAFEAWTRRNTRSETRLAIPVRAAWAARSEKLRVEARGCARAAATREHCGVRAGHGPLGWHAPFLGEWVAIVLEGLNFLGLVVGQVFEA